MPENSTLKDRLPVYELEAALLEQLCAGDGCRVVVEAPTGSGKSTQVPQILLDGGVARSGEIVVLQPRRIAARMLARRVAAERRCKTGGEVGYQVRFEKAVGSETRIRYVTEGVLLREMLGDPALAGVSVIVFDEFHERHLYGDVTLARALDLQEAGRPDLKVVVMSATLDSGRLCEYLGGCEILRSEGRTFPVEVRYAPPRRGLDKTLPEQVVRACGEVMGKGGDGGDVLVFLPGGFEIRKTVSLLKNKSWARDVDILPLYGDLPPKQQDVAVTRGVRRKIVVATNVAETSVTIDGVTVVIDAGLARVADFDPRRGINTLTVRSISKASADQRAGRAGRTAPGVAVRLWSESDHHRRPAQEAPEVARLDLAEVVLTFKASGITDLENYRWLDKPDPAGLALAERLLRELGALSPVGGGITETGRLMTRFPLHPRHARVLIAAAGEGCLDEAALAVALGQGRGIFFRGGGDDTSRGTGAFAMDGDTSDYQPQIRAWQYAAGKKYAPDACSELGVNAGAAREAGALYHQFLKICQGIGIGQGGEGRSPHPERLGKALLAGFSDYVAMRYSAGSAGFHMVDGRRGRAAGDSILRGVPLLVAGEVAEVEGKEVRVVLRDLTAVDEAWLEELFPGDFSVRQGAAYDGQARRVIARQERVFRDLVLESRERGEPDPMAAAELLAREVEAGNLLLKKWDHSVEQWIARVNSLSEWMPELEIPRISDEDRVFLFQQVCTGAKSYRDIKDRSPWTVLKTWLSQPQAVALDSYVPERITLANGRGAKVAYSAGGDPKIKLKLQHLYDVDKNPTVAGGKVAVVVEVLAPNQRPVQVTKDLAAFWENSYPEVKKQLKGRYPKHEWR